MPHLLRLLLGDTSTFPSSGSQGDLHCWIPQDYNLWRKKYLLLNVLIFTERKKEKERDKGRERETSISCSTYLYIHWWIFVCTLTRD